MNCLFGGGWKMLITLLRAIEADFGLGPVQYPESFWKVVVVAEPDANGRKALKAYGFVLSRRMCPTGSASKPSALAASGGTRSRFGRTTLTGVTFDRVLYDADQKAN